MPKWIKVPGPGEFRGEGQWFEIDEKKRGQLEEWEHCRKTGYLPVREQDEKPGDDET